VFCVGNYPVSEVKSIAEKQNEDTVFQQQWNGRYSLLKNKGRIIFGKRSVSISTEYNLKPQA